MVLAPLVLAACGSSGDTLSPTDAAPGVLIEAGAPPPQDAALDAASGNDATFTMPEVPSGCPPSAGNEHGIGAPCSATGGECAGSLQCSCQDWLGYRMPVEMPCFCTNVAFGNTCAACGSNATCCTYEVPIQPGATLTISACFPAACAPGDQCPAI
jgi:hypothetical protein